MRRYCITLALGLLLASLTGAQQHALPDTSIYRLPGSFSDQDGHPRTLVSLRGSPVLLAMFYGSCRTMCPVIIEDARAIDAALTPEERQHLRVVFVTIDPVRDTPERLRELVTERSLPVPRWMLLRGGDSDIRALAMVLGFQYRRLPDGNYAHSAMLTLLDTEGRIAVQIEGLRQPNAPIVDRIRQMLAPHG